MAAGQLNTMAETAGVELDLRRDILDNLGAELMAVQVSPSAPTPGDMASFLAQDQVIVLTIRQRQGVELAIEALKGMAGQGSELFDSRDYLDTTIFSLKVPQVEGTEGPDPDSMFSYALTEDSLLLAFGGTASLEAVLVGMRSPRELVWRKPAVRTAMAQLPPGAVALQYQDLAALGSDLFATLGFLCSMQAGDAFCDPTAIPDEEAIAAHLGAMVSGVYKTSRSLVMRFRILPPQGS
jgi:hypothetical protein